MELIQNNSEIDHSLKKKPRPHQQGKHKLASINQNTQRASNRGSKKGRENFRTTMVNVVM